MFNEETHSYSIKNDTKILYESKGRKKKYGTGIACIITILVFFLLYQLLGAISDRLYVEKTGRTTYEHEQFMENYMIVLAIAIYIVIALVIYLIRLSNSTKRCWLKIYDDHIEAQTMSFSWNTKRENIIYMLIADIDSIEKSGRFFEKIKIYANGKKYRLLCQDTAQAYAILNQLVLEKKRARY